MKNFVFLMLTIFVFISCKPAAEDTAPAEEVRGKGYKPGSNKSSELVEEADIDEDMFNLPSSFSLDGPPIVNQKSTSKCVAFSGAYYILSMYNGVKSNAQNLDKAASPEFAYAMYKKLNKDNNCDDGSFLFDQPENNIIGVSSILKDYGTTSWNQTPFVNGKACTVLNATQQSQAEANRIDDFYRLDKSEFSDTQELKAWLYAGFPLWFAVDIDEGFQDLETNIWNKAIGKNEGGHAMTIVGYDDSKKAFKIANSWGEEWGDKGFGWVDYTYLRKLMSDDNTEIGVLYPNAAQRPVFNKLSPASCGNANWGDVLITNKRNQEIAIEMLQGTTYKNDNVGNVDANEYQIFSGIPKGSVKVRVFDADKKALIKEYTINVTQCEEVELVVN